MLLAARHCRMEGKRSEGEEAEAGGPSRSLPVTRALRQCVPVPTSPCLDSPAIPSACPRPKSLSGVGDYVPVSGLCLVLCQEMIVQPLAANPPRSLPAPVRSPAAPPLGCPPYAQPPATPSPEDHVKTASEGCLTHGSLWQRGLGFGSMPHTWPRAGEAPAQSAPRGGAKR